jgi:hypothetical protein
VRTLPESLTDPSIRPRAVDAFTTLIDREVAGRGGLSGMAIRAGYAVVKALKPTMMRDAVDALLPDFAAALEPFRAEAPGPAFERKLCADPDRAASALLSVTDRRMETAKTAVIKKTYARLRGLAQDQVKQSVPAIAAALAPFAE